MIDEHGSQIASDLSRFHQISIYDVVAGKVPAKYVLALLENLPEDSAFVTAIRGGPEYAGWNRQTYVMADVYDAISFLAYTYISANSKKKPKALDPYPRPGDAEREAEKKKLPNPLLLALRGEEIPKEAIGPGSVIPLPPKKG